MKSRRETAKSMSEGFRGLAHRSEAARERFIEYCREKAGLSRAEAERVIEVYKKARIIRFDAVNGTFHVKHGAFLDKEILRKAAL